jgi:isocitrate dehydrogenase (NAD+)
MAHQVTLLPGDGVGPEVIAAARTVLDATGVKIDWDVQDAGAGAAERGGEALPKATVESIRKRGVALKGPTATPRSGHRSANVGMRAALGLHTSIRPVNYGGVDLVVARMNGEDLYAGIEWEAGSEGAHEIARIARQTLGAEIADDAGIGLKPISRSAVERSVHTALAWAEAAGRKRVTIAHKATVMRHTDGLFLETARAAAADHTSLTVDDALVDTLCGDVARRPERYDVLLAPVLYGDLLSDLAAGLAGGPGIAPSANLGDDCAVFEPVHGSAPRIAGRNIANPFAAILAGAMLLRHLKEPDAAARVEAAVAASELVTYDLMPERVEADAPLTDAVAASVAEAVGG